MDSVEKSFCTSVLFTLEISFASSPTIVLNGNPPNLLVQEPLGQPDPPPFSAATPNSVELLIFELQSGIETGLFF